MVILILFLVIGSLMLSRSDKGMIRESDSIESDIDYTPKPKNEPEVNIQESVNEIRDIIERSELRGSMTSSDQVRGQIILDRLKPLGISRDDVTRMIENQIDEEVDEEMRGW